MTIKILVTGGAGNVGGSLVRRLVQNNNYQVIIVDNLLTGNINKLPSKEFSNWRFIKADVNNYNQISSIMLSFPFDYVFHYAAVVGVQRTLNNPKLVLDDIDGIKNILDLSKNTGVKRVFFSSSSEVYGEPVEIPQIEKTTPLNARLPYAIVKSVSESFCRSYQQEYDLDYTIFRFFNTYGALQSDDFVISKFISLALKNKDLTIYGDGLQSRTFCYIDDNLDATIGSLEHEKWINTEVNIGSDIEINIVNLAKFVIETLNSKSTLKHLPALKEGDMTRRMPDNTKMKKFLNRDLITLEQGILKTAEFLKI
jgi:UDP-glucose 4-epimerase